MSIKALSSGDQAPDCKIQFSDGQWSTVHELCAERPLLIAFTRHLGCSFCREQLLQLKAHFADFEKANIEVIAVTMRPLAATRSIEQQLDLPFRCVADPQRVAYRAFMTERGSVWRVMGPSIWLPAIRALFRGGMGVPLGDLMQLHASVLLDTNARVLFAHYPATSADQLDCESALNQVCSMP